MACQETWAIIIKFLQNVPLLNWPSSNIYSTDLLRVYDDDETELIRFFFRWCISVVCPVTVFTSLCFRTWWPNWRNLFGHFKKIGLWPKKNIGTVVKWQWICSYNIEFAEKYVASEFHVHRRKVCSCITAEHTQLPWPKCKLLFAKCSLHWRCVTFQGQLSCSPFS